MSSLLERGLEVSRDGYTKVMRWLQDPRTSWVVLILSTILLGVLATLQYRWLGEISRAEGERLRAGLDSALERFSLDFDRELTRVALEFMDRRPQPLSSGNEGPGSEGAVVAARLSDWQETASYPGLVDRIIRLARDARGRVVSSCLDVVTEIFEACDEPSFEPLVDRFEEAIGSRRGMGPPTWPPILVPGQTAVAVPRFASGEATRRSGLAGAYVIRFDPEVLRTTLVPELGSMHLQWGDLEFDFGLFVHAEAGDPTPFFLSDPERPASHYLEGDRRIDLFRPLRRETVRELFLERGADDPGLFGRPPGRPGRDDHEVGAARGRHGPGRRPSRVPPRGEAGEGGRPRPEFSGHLLASAEWRPWWLAVRHPQGSLEAAVRRARARNIGVSSAVLLLLGLSLTMLLVSVRRAQELSARRVELVAGITHELRTPLAVIRSLAQNLADGIVDKPEQAQRYGAMLEQQGTRLSSLVEQSLELAGILSERQAYAFEPVEVTEAVTQAISDCRPLLAEDGRFETDFADGLPPVSADPGALRRAIGNLIANAAKYGDGWVGVDVFLADGGPRAEIGVRIRDRGPGIPRDEIPRLFEAFYRGRDASDAQLPGSGLGLHLVKHVVDAHGGRIDVDSEVGQGSRFTLFLPAVRGHDD